MDLFLLINHQKK